MEINWPLIVVLFGISIPGVLIAIPRIISFLLPNNTPELKNRFSRIIIIQTLVMVFMLSFAGSLLSAKTGLSDPLLVAILEKNVALGRILDVLPYVFIYTFFGLIVFCGLYYGVAPKVVDAKSLETMKKLRTVLKLDGRLLYGGVVEEVIARWGLMNLTAFFLLLFIAAPSPLVMWSAIVLSGFLFATSQLPAYIAAGCSSDRRFRYVFVSLSLSQSLIFGFLFWQYGLVLTIFAHMAFHLGWAAIDYVIKTRYLV